MSKNILLFVALSLILISEIDIYAQELNGIPVGPIPKMKAVTNKNLTNQVSTSASNAYGYSSIQEYTLSIPIPMGSPFTLLTPYSFSEDGFASSMCKGGDGKYYITYFYFVPPFPDPLLFELNPVDGNITVLGTITGVGTETPLGISFNPSDGSYYLITEVSLYLFDIETRVASYIGSFGLTDGLIADLCFDESGTCYAIAIGSAIAYTIDIVTGQPTPLGPLGYNALYGHGMSYDFETGTIYISAFNFDTFSGQLRAMDPLTGNTILIADWGVEQVAPFAIDTYYGPPCPISSPMNPNPANGSSGIDVSLNELTWTNDNYTTDVEVWFGTPGSTAKVYDGPVISSWEMDTLNYSTTYNWRIICKNDSCSTAGSYWSFLTESDSSVIFYEPFNNLDCWTPIGPYGIQNWFLSFTNYAGGSPTSEIKLKGYEYNPFDGLSQLISCPTTDDSYHYIVKFRHMVDVGSGTPWSKIGIAVSYDGGVSKETIWETPISVGMGPEEIETEFYPSADTFQIIIYYNGFSVQIYDWYVDDLKLIDDCMECFPPPTPYNVNALNYHYPYPHILVVWADSAWNEEAFQVLRKNGFPTDPGEYEVIGIKPTSPYIGHSYMDTTVVVDSTYTYGIIAYNQYGYSDTSETVTISVEPIPVELITFYCEIVNGGITLYWSTATELNNLGFEIERKTDEEFFTIGFVEGNGSTTEIHNYSYIDHYAERGNNYYRLKQIDYNGSFSYSDEIEVENNIPDFYSLEQNYPNPFNPSTKIAFSLPPHIANGTEQSQLVTLKIYDVLGNEVATLINEKKSAGSYEVEFNGNGFTSGIYFYQLKAGTFVETKKMILLK